MALQIVNSRGTNRRSHSENPNVYYKSIRSLTLYTVAIAGVVAGRVLYPLPQIVSSLAA
jgi:hypothetical protein